MTFWVDLEQFGDRSSTVRSDKNSGKLEVKQILKHDLEYNERRHTLRQQRQDGSSARQNWPPSQFRVPLPCFKNQFHVVGQRRAQNMTLSDRQVGRTTLDGQSVRARKFRFCFLTTHKRLFQASSVCRRLDLSLNVVPFMGGQTAHTRCVPFSKE